MTTERYDIPDLRYIKDTLTDRHPQNINYLQPDGFRFHLHRIPKLVQFVQSASMPDISIGTINQPSRLVPIKHPGTAVEFGNIDVQFLVDEDMEAYRELDNWIRRMVAIDDWNSIDPGDNNLSEASLFILNNQKRINTIVRFKNIFPVSISGWEFSSIRTDADSIVATVSFAYTSFEIEKV